MINIIKNKNIFTNTLILLLSTILSIGLRETIVRLMGLAPVVYRIKTKTDGAIYKLSSNPILGYELKKNARDPDSNNSVNTKTNSHGQWDIERTFLK